ncbi:hypothetical protein [Segnochrobactrum spirostomi]|uniref:Antitoxin n=1 Tax=Segnochrobactrum spirostomi TaxID=2608987 RepID=A0A6A7Y4H1_9HYPH|nr:hypothetical protein [Segnochrobactrum spirostomi]MQT12609.1 hypothetical protein [Segnochrobactrum spirostomi]
MIELSDDIEYLARRMAARSGQAPEQVIRAALEREARAQGFASRGRARRMTVEEMLALGRTIAALPLLDPRSASEIADDLN